MRRAGPGFIMNPVRLFAVYIYMNRRVLPAIYRMAFWNPVFSAIALILENFCLCLIQRTLGELPNFGVMIWQLYYMLRSALICFQVTRFRNKGNHFI